MALPHKENPNPVEVMVERMVTAIDRDEDADNFDS